MSATPRATGPAAGPRTTVGVAGAGRVGAVLGAGLREAGLPVVAASGRSAASAHRIARLLPGTPRVPVADVVRAADLVLFAVPDDALGPLVAHLAESGLFRPGQVCCTPRARTVPASCTRRWPAVRSRWRYTRR